MDTKVSLPSEAALKRSFQRSRAHLFPPNLTNRYFPIPKEYQPLVLFDSNEKDTERIIVVWKQELLNLLIEPKCLVGDGTFKVVPELFYQLYTLHAVIGMKLVFKFKYIFKTNF